MTKPLYKMTNENMALAIARRNNAKLTLHGPYNAESGHWICAPGTAQDYRDLGSDYTAGQIERGEIQPSLQWCKINKSQYETLAKRIGVWSQDGA